MFVSKSIAAVATLAILAGCAAYADEMHLTSSEYDTVVSACEVGLPMFPVESDFGYSTGQFALPISGDSGKVNSALIISEDALLDIPECRANVEFAIAERDAESSEQSSAS